MISKCIWNLDTLGKKETFVDNHTACGIKDRKVGLMSRAASSLTRWADVRAARNKAFKDSRRISQVATGSKS